MDDRVAYSLDRPPALQHPGELDQFVKLLQRENVQSYLEIGARYGGTFGHVMMSLPECRGAMVDFPDGNFGDEFSLPFLLNLLVHLRNWGRDVKTVFGPSAAPEVVDRVREHGPYDAILIDADHSYDALMRDFANYAPMAKKMVILHDIVGWGQSERGLPVEVPKVWKELKRGRNYLEIVEPGSVMGLGVIFTNAPGNAVSWHGDLGSGEQEADRAVAF